MIKKLFSLTILACAATGLMAQPAGGKKISNELIGIFFEDISSSADGGLCAELVQNGRSAMGGARVPLGSLSVLDTRSVILRLVKSTL